MANGHYNNYTTSHKLNLTSSHDMLNLSGIRIKIQIIPLCDSASIKNVNNLSGITTSCHKSMNIMEGSQRSLTVASYEFNNLNCCNNGDSCCPLILHQPINVTNFQLCTTVDDESKFHRNVNEIMLFKCVKTSKLPITLHYDEVCIMHFSCIDYSNLVYCLNYPKQYSVVYLFSCLVSANIKFIALISHYTIQMKH